MKVQTIKVLIVDDENLERVLIRKGFNWEENGFEIIGEANNGEKALEILANNDIDLMITDINMPFMDGLTLTEKALSSYDRLKTIIVTGYRDFEYAQKAIKLGVKDFLLKPLRINDLEKIVIKLKAEIYEEKQIETQYDKLKKLEKENHSILLDSFLQLLVEDRIEKQDALDKLELYNIAFLQKNCVCINIKCHYNNEIKSKEKDNIQDKIEQILLSADIQNKINFVHYLGNNIMLLSCDKEDYNRIELEAIKIRDSINNEIMQEVTIGISDINLGLEGISKSYRQSELAIGAFTTLGKNACITYNEYESMKMGKSIAIDLDWNDFTFSIENCLRKKTIEYIEIYIDKIKNNNGFDIECIKIMSMNMVSIATTVITKKGKNFTQLVDDENYIYNGVINIKTFEDMHSFLVNVIDIIMGFLKSGYNKRKNHLVDKAISYIQLNLTSPELSLKTVAKSLFVNESYLSRVFKQEVGESLIEYITAKRIEKSIELLNTTDLKAYEIAAEIGICDPHYFGICFKKYVGKTIKQFKNR